MTSDVDTLIIIWADFASGVFLTDPAENIDTCISSFSKRLVY
jgi:hypothetical protein